ncbi:hypothetical protein IV53_GL000619 [Ligilactobacillus ceti DSM 22408]|uniref:MacB-like periplasmic core domain-containing protein n=1 Tax=Ligilactobacillus ceti DSM 22408 TaxID=1122146 RepID=A0A0R2KH12_9LACO|nr:hypothetical protein IV53_GL000619 [Ligilactobacillus ceti DSM 22408]
MAFISVFTFYKIQERDYINKLNNSNLSLDAYKVTFKDNPTFEDVFNKIHNDKKIKNIQMHLTNPQQPQITYFYGKGDFATPPMDSGDFFSDADFSTNVSVAVVGKNIVKQLYTPKDQSYLKMGNKYIPVIGVMGDKYTSKLDNKIFLTCPIKKSQELHLKGYQVKLDGKAKLDPDTLKKELSLTTVQLVTPKNILVPKQSWIGKHKWEVVALVAVVIGVIFEMVIWITLSRKQYLEAIFMNKTPERFVFEQWEYYALFTGLGSILGTLIGLFSVNLETYRWVLTYLGIIYILANILFYLLMQAKVKTFKKN